MTKYSLEKRITYISTALEDLAYALKRYDAEADENDKKMAYYASEKKAEEVVESSVALNQDILFNEFNYVSGSYKDSFKDLSKLNLFSKGELKVLMETAKFRNRLAHDYLELSEDETVKQMKNFIRIYPEYIKKMVFWLDKQK